MKIRFTEAIKQGIVPVGKSKLHDDANKGLFSWTTDNQGKRVADIAELERHYGKLNTPDTNGQPTDDHGQFPSDDHGLAQTLETENARLKAQLAEANERERHLHRTNQKLVDMLFDAQADNRALMRRNGKPLMLPPAPAKKSWWDRIRMFGFF